MRRYGCFNIRVRIRAVAFSADRFKSEKALKLRTKRTARRIHIRRRARVCKQTFVSSVLHLKSSSPMQFLMRQLRLYIHPNIFYRQRLPLYAVNSLKSICSPQRFNSPRTLFTPYSDKYQLSLLMPNPSKVLT